jgi:hypothetical protein
VMQVFRHRVPRIVIAVAARENYNAYLHLANCERMTITYAAPLAAGAAAFLRVARLFSTGG